jgi:hypothetical protein
LVGDLLLISNYEDGYYFGPPVKGIHGGLHPDDSKAAMAIGFPGKDDLVTNKMKTSVIEALQRRCQREGGRSPSTSDLITCLEPVTSFKK